ncbi:hypothetical protein IFR05_000325 [Cadophora sp. M221]|nr:hypothetical protein IFR05_000325 [Cadophora sp. M221]
MRFILFAVTAIFLSPICATFGPSYDEGSNGWPSYDKDGKHSKPSKTYGWDWGHDDDDDDDKYGHHKSKNIGWTKTHAPKSYQTHHIPKTHGTNPGKDHKTITYSDTPQYPLPTTADTPPSYSIIPQPSTESVASSTVPIIVPTPQPVTSLVSETSSRAVPSTTAPPQQGNTTVPTPPIFTGDAVAPTSQRGSLLITIGAVLLFPLLI